MFFIAFFFSLRPIVGAIGFVRDREQLINIFRLSIYDYVLCSSRRERVIVHFMAFVDCRQLPHAAIIYLSYFLFQSMNAVWFDWWHRSSYNTLNCRPNNVNVNKGSILQDNLILFLRLFHLFRLFRLIQ